MDDTVQPERVTAVRVDWVDTAKGLGIILVVVGHVLRGLVASHVMQSTAGFQFVDSWIYSFHMPLFFFLSGLFLFRSATKSGWCDFASDKLRTIAYPYVVWSIVTVLIKASLGRIPNKPLPLSDILVIPYEPLEQFWFLYALFVLVLFFGTLFAFGMRPWMGIIVALLVYVDVVPISPNWSVFYEARGYAIYVALGALLGTKSFHDTARINSSMFALIAIAGLLLPAIVVGAGSEQRWSIALALSGTAGIAAASILLDRFNRAPLAGLLGRYALEIYVGHTIASGAVRIVLETLHVRSSGIHVIVGVIAGLCFPLALVYGFKVIGFHFAFTYPKKPDEIRPSPSLLT